MPFDAMFSLQTNAYRVANINDQLDINVLANQNCDFMLYLDGLPIAQTTNSNALSHTFNVSSPGKHCLKFEATIVASGS